MERTLFARSRGDARQDLRRRHRQRIHRSLRTHPKTSAAPRHVNRCKGTKFSPTQVDEKTMRLCLGLSIGLWSLATPAFAEDLGCKPIHTLIRNLNAVKQARLINHWTNDGFNNFGTQEVILVDWSACSRWKEGPWSVNKRELTPDAVSNCHKLRDEIVNGVSTLLYIYDLHDYGSFRSNRSSLRWIRRTSRNVSRLIRSGRTSARRCEQCAAGTTVPLPLI